MHDWLVVWGTRPELAKLHSVVRALRNRGQSVVCWHTGQHTDLLAATADTPEHRGFVTDSERLGVATCQDPVQFAAWVADCITRRLSKITHPRGIIVQGDTASAYAGALAGAHLGIPVAHVEAGVRTGDRSNPWPEEQFRVHIDRVARWHFAPTEMAAQNLAGEGVLGTVTITGNTGIDDLYQTIGSDQVPLRPLRRVMLTLHRRETHARLRELVEPLDWWARHHPEIEILWPVHPNPAVQAVADTCGGITRIAPLGLRAFRWMLARSQVVVTDSGGVQEEACHLGVPCLVARDVTDRPESIKAGMAELVGTGGVGLTRAVIDAVERPHMTRIPTPVFGNGRAGDLIADVLAPQLVEAA